MQLVVTNNTMTTKTCTNGHTMTGIGFDECPECEAPWTATPTVERVEEEVDEPCPNEGTMPYETFHHCSLCAKEHDVGDDRVEEIKKEFDAWYHSQREMNPYIMRDWFLQRFAECEAKGREEGAKAERASVVHNVEEVFKSLPVSISKFIPPDAVFVGVDAAARLGITHLTTQSEDNQKEV